MVKYLQVRRLVSSDALESRLSYALRFVEVDVQKNEALKGFMKVSMIE